MTILFTLEEMIAATEGEFSGAQVQGVRDLSIDSRTLEREDAYFAIKGDVHDGHKFVDDALAKGASLAVVSRERKSWVKTENAPLIAVDDVLGALEKLARFARERAERAGAKIIAVTGSVGKTTTKEMLRLALEGLGQGVHASQASYNNHWGVPLSLAKMPPKSAFGIFEIGMNHGGEITPLTRLVRPHIAIVNNVAPVHLEAFDSIAGIARAKAEIFEGLDENGTAVLNRDDEEIFDILEKAARKKTEKVMTFGQGGKGGQGEKGAKGAGDVRLEDVRLHPSCSCLKADVSGTPVLAKIGAPGRHIAMNALAVFAVLSALEVDAAPCILALAHMRAIKGRGERHVLEKEGGTLHLIDESYNANPVSMKAALDLLGRAPVKGRGRRIAVLGDMLELGRDSADLHEGLRDAILDNQIDQTILVGAEMTALARALEGRAQFIHEADIDFAIAPLMNMAQKDDIIMAKASFGMRFSRLIEALLTRYGSSGAQNAQDKG